MNGLGSRRTDQDSIVEWLGAALGGLGGGVVDWIRVRVLSTAPEENDMKDKTHTQEQLHIRILNGHLFVEVKKFRKILGHTHTPVHEHMHYHIHLNSSHHG